MLPNVPNSIMNNRQVFEPQEIHLQQANLGDGVHITLGDHLPFVTPCQRTVFIKIPVTNNDSRGMHAGVAVQAFQLNRMAPKLLPS